MAVSCSVAVMAHPSRAELVERLLERLDRQATVAWDERGIEWDTGRRALLAFDPSATHHVVLQDDALICRDLIAGLERALHHAPPEAVLGLYVGAVRPYESRITRAVALAEERELAVSWLILRGLFWGVGTVLPTALLESLVATQDRARNVAEYDRRISLFLVRNAVPVWYPWPSLVDHAPVPSLLGHGQNGLGHSDGRVAQRFIGEDASALELDWTGGAAVVMDPRRRQNQHWPRRVSAVPRIPQAPG